MVHHEVVLSTRPTGVPGPEHFTVQEATSPPLQDGQLLIRVTHVSVDPAMRGWVNAVANYSEPVGIGEVMRSFAVGDVVESRHPEYAEGEVLMGMFGWQEMAVVGQDAIWRRVTETDLPRSLSVGVLGLTGLTAWAGVASVLRPRPGSTVVVSSAAGAVGSVAGQLAASMGCRTVGVAGGPEKARRLVDEYGFDAGVDYRSDSFVDDLAAATPDGVDHYFDNTSGPITDAVVARFNPFASMMVCGTAAYSSWDPWPQGPRMERIILTQRVRIEGFLAFDHLDSLPDAVAGLADLIRSGRLVQREHTLSGLEAAPGSIAMLYAGENTGKLVIEL